VSGLCHHCGGEVNLVERVGRRHTCLHCGSDLHCCRNCRFYDPAAHNQCREPQTERQVDKERGNFCELFSFSEIPRAIASPAGDARAKLESLFAARKRS
jgi:hypothetical protein